MGWADILDVAAKVGEAVAVVALAFLLWEHHKREHGKEIMEWQKAEVFRIISERGPISEDDIKTHYITEVIQQRRLRHLGQRDVDQLKIRAIVLELLSSNVIRAYGELQNEHKIEYCANLAFRPVPVPKFDLDATLYEHAAFFESERAVLAYIQENSGKYTEAEIMEHFISNNQFPRPRLLAVLADLHRSGQILLGTNGRLGPRAYRFPEESGSKKEPEAHTD